MTSTIWPQEMVDAFKPDFVAPVVGYLTSEANEEHSQLLFEVSGGWVAATRWQRAGGHAFSHGKAPTPEQVVKKWKKITDFTDGRASNPASTSDSLGDIIANFGQANEEAEEEAAGGAGDYSE